MSGVRLRDSFPGGLGRYGWKLVAEVAAAGCGLSQDGLRISVRRSWLPAAVDVARGHF